MTIFALAPTLVFIITTVVFAIKYYKLKKKKHVQLKGIDKEIVKIEKILNGITYTLMEKE